MSFNKTLSNKYKLNRSLEALDLSTFNNSNQITFNLGNNKVIINVNTPSSTRTYTIPDIGTDGTFYISGGSQPITGSLIPSANDTYDIGSSTYGWRNLYIYDIINPGNVIQLGTGSDYTNLTAQNLSGGGINTVTIPSYTDTVCLIASPQTLTNKTLTSPTINTPILNAPSFSGISTGVFQNSNQPLFDVGLSASVTGVTGAGTKYNIIFNSINNIFGSGTFDSTTGGYTVEVAGYYYISTFVQFSGISSSNTDIQILINVSGSYYYTIIEVGSIAGANGVLSLNGAMLRQCYVNDVIYISVQVSGSTTNNVGVNAGSGQTRFWGYLIPPS